MTSVVKRLYREYFADPEAVILLGTMAVLSVFLVTTIHMLAPVYASMIIAYLLEGSVSQLEKTHMSHLLSVSVVTIVATGLFFATVLWCAPLAWQESRNFVNELPNFLQSLQTHMLQWPDHHNDLLTPDQIKEFIGILRNEAAGFGKHVVSFSVGAIPNVIELVVYAILVPMMVFFFLLDGRAMIAWMEQFLPRQSRLVHQVCSEVNLQTARYVRGKCLELGIVFSVNVLLFKVVGLNYAILLAFFTGVSVLIPYIGVLVVSIPVVMVGFLQFDFTSTYLYLLLGYGVVMLLDGNVLVPLLFSETMAIHPVAIIIAIIFFGGIWGFWGIFFAIPLATVVKAMINAWPKNA